MKIMLVMSALFALGGPGLASAQTHRDGFIKTSDGVRIHYIEAGTGKPIVLVPGWMLPGWIWQKQIDALSRKYHVIAVDPRSQGESDKPTFGHLMETRARDYKELIAQLKLQQPVLVGWSMGTLELLTYVEHYGDAGIGGLVLVDGLILAKQNPPVVAVLSDWTYQLQQDRNKEADIFVRSMFQKPQPEDYLQRLEQATLQVPTDTAVALIHNMIAVSDFSKAFSRISRPVLVVYEPLLQPNADYLKSQLRGKARFERFDGDGHALFVDDAPRFNQVVEAFVKALPKP